LPRVFELYGDEVGCALSVAGRDSVKSLVQRFCPLPIPDRRDQSVRGPTRGTSRLPIAVMANGRVNRNASLS
jgi:hypothetical protein